jgi:integrase
MARKKRSRGEYGAGTTYQTKKGEWFAAFPLGNGRKSTRRVASEPEGDAWRAEMKRQRDSQGIDIASAQTLFSDYAGDWVGALRKQKPTTIDSYKDLLEYYILDFVEGVRFSDLRKQHFDMMLQTLLDEGYAVSQIRNAVNLAARILDDALSADLVPKNYAALMRKDVPATPDSIGVVLTIDQVRAFLAAARWRYKDDGALLLDKDGKPVPNRMELVYWFELLYGTRKGETLGLRTTSFTTDLFTIDKQVRELPGGIKLTDVKTKGSKRTLPIVSVIAERMADHLAAQRAERERWGVEWHNHWLVFPAENGNPKSPRNMQREFKLVLKAAALPETIRMHDLRHTAATHAGEMGMEEYVIAAMLGHGKANATRRYAKATMQSMQAVLENVARSYGMTEEVPNIAKIGE